MAVENRFHRGSGSICNLEHRQIKIFNRFCLGGSGVPRAGEYGAAVFKDKTKIENSGESG